MSTSASGPQKRPFLSSDGEPFRFRTFLLADLRRYRALMNPGASGKASLAKVFVSPRFGPVFLCRASQAANARGLGIVGKFISMINFTVFGIEIGAQTWIGGGLFIAHSQGTVIGARSIGWNATIYHGVTVGARTLDVTYTESQRPIVGNDVLMGVGSTILGGITVGDRVKIGAAALVMRSVPADTIVRAPLGEYHATSNT